MNSKKYNNQSRRNFLQNSSLVIAGISFSKFGSFAASLNYPLQNTVNNIPQTILSDPKLKLKFKEERMVLDDGLQPYMLCTSRGTLIVQSQISKKPVPQKRISCPSALTTVVSRDEGKTWKEFAFNPGENWVNFEGGITELKDGTILMLDTYVTPGEKPGTGEGLLYVSEDDFKSLQEPVNITFNLPGVNFYNSSDDAGRPHEAVRLHRRILELPNGDLLTTLYGWFEGYDETNGYMPTTHKTLCVLLRSTNGGRHWDMVSKIATQKGIGTEGFSEPVIVRVSQGPKTGRLICMMRTGCDLYEAISDDEGKTWTKAVPRVFADIDVYKTDSWSEMFKDIRIHGVLISENPSELIGAVVNPDLIELRSGILVAAFGVRLPARGNWINPEHPWNGNYLAFSFDHGETWSHVTCMTSGIFTTHYMTVEELPDDNQLFVVYDFGSWGNKQGRYTYGRKIKLSFDR